MVSILEKLSIRIGQRQRKNAATWSQFVGDVVDEKLKDADEILAGLDVLGKSPEDLQAACGLLIQRREWGGVAKAGDAAEAEYPKLTQQAADAEKELSKMIERHHAKYAPLESKIFAARESISSGADAKRRLLDTCSAESESAATADVDLRIQELQAAKSDVSRRHRDCESWVLNIDSRGDSAATTDMAKLPAMREKLAGLELELKTFSSKLQALQDERGKASESLLRPEMI